MEGFRLFRPIWVLVVFALTSGCSAQSYLDSNIEDEIGLNTSQVLRQRGYVATEYNLPTQNGQFAVNVIVAENPLVDYSSSYVAQKQPVVFWHGTLFNGTCFITDTPAPASPKDFSRFNASRMTDMGMRSLYAGIPNSLSLVLILLDFGHKVIVVNRRNVIASLKAYAMLNNKPYVDSPSVNGSAEAVAALLDPSTNLTDPNNAFLTYFQAVAATQDPSRWRYSTDEMARYDLPVVIDFTINITGFSTVITVGWSSGGQIILQGLSTQPELNKKSKF